ncbi:MAG: restriction endonuclease subunit S, partial [Thermoguttaceae bacterium]|nr:restriction endonuclease subunit S [Thermoguttaceae bacterium]
KLYTKAFIDHSVGCAQAYITRETFENIEISDISFEDQKAIVSVLELLDERIENNKAICADLEAMAKLLYDYWFVQFDFPDENGKPYKSSGGKMVWNEELKREIPEGWEVVPISNICTVVSGYPFDSDSYNENGNYHVLTIKNIQDGYVSPITNSNVSEIPSDIPDYDILHIGDILMSLTGNVGRVAVLCGENYLLNQRASLIQPEDSRIKWYLYFLFRSETIFTQIQRVATGTSQKNVSPTDIGNIRIAHSDDIVRAFSSYIESIMQKFVHSNVENQQLAFLRDFLLPMLMNGQVKVGETKE